MSGASKEDLEQDVVEEKGAEHAAQLLALLDVPQGERLAEIVLVCLLHFLPWELQPSAPDHNLPLRLVVKGDVLLLRFPILKLKACQSHRGRATTAVLLFPCGGRGRCSTQRRA